MKSIQTPYYLIDERKILRNLRVIDTVRRKSGIKILLALKCFSTWAVFPLMRRFMDGTTSSGVYEARLGREKFGKEVQVYSAAFSRNDVLEVRAYADKIIFNSVSQLENLGRIAKGMNTGVRVNPGFSYSKYDLADPARRFSRLGITDIRDLKKAMRFIKGFMFHFNCENDDYGAFSSFLDRIAERYGEFLRNLEWISLGGGIFLTKPSYPVSAFSQKLKDFGSTFGIQLYLEPGEAAITGAGELVTTVLDTVYNEKRIAIVDASVEAHLLDHLIYRTSPPLTWPAAGRHRVIIAGRSCLAGDIFGEYCLKKKLKQGDKVRFGEAAGYSIVKKNWFNGLVMPSICVRRLSGHIDVVREFGYESFKKSLS